MRFSAFQTLAGAVVAFLLLLPVFASAQIPRENAIQTDLLAETLSPAPSANKLRSTCCRISMRFKTTATRAKR